MRWNTGPGPSRLAATLIAALLLPMRASAQPAGDVSPPPPDYAAAAFDAAIVRPIGLSVVVLGAVWFVPAAILASPGGRPAIREAWERFVLVPGRYVFVRPLGAF
jgi:hypothetical protein